MRFRKAAASGSWRRVFSSIRFGAGAVFRETVAEVGECFFLGGGRQEESHQER